MNQTTTGSTLCRLGLIAAMGAMGLVAAGCDEDDGFVRPPPTEPTEEGTASLRVAHSSADAPAVDVYVAGVGDPLIRDLSYGEVSGYIDVAARTYTIEVRQAGADPASDPVFISDPVGMAQNTEVTIVAAGLLAGPADAAFRLLPLVETFSPPAAGEALIRVVHAGADAPAVALDLGDDGSAEITALARFDATDGAGIPVPAGQALQVGILTSDAQARVTAFTTPELAAGAEYFIIATGLLADLPRQPKGFVLFPMDHTAALSFVRQNPVVSALHGSPDAPPVDIVTGDSLLVENLSFGELSGPVQVPPGRYELGILPTGADPASPSATATTPQLVAGERYLAVATGFVTTASGQAWDMDHGEPFQLLFAQEKFDAEATSGAQLAFIHASPDAPPVTVGAVEGDVIVAPTMADDVAFAEITATVALPAADLTVGLAPAGTMTPVVTFPVTTANGDRAFAVAIGALTPDAGQQPLLLSLVDTTIFPWANQNIAATTP
jgi:hypothetical protein